MENQQFLHKKIRKEMEKSLGNLPLQNRAKTLARNHTKCIAIAQKHKLNIYEIKNKEECYEQKN